MDRQVGCATHPLVDKIWIQLQPQTPRQQTPRSLQIAKGLAGRRRICQPKAAFQA
jgi:hypothetical protein